MKNSVVFGDSSMALETMSRLDRETNRVIYAAQTEAEANFIRAQGFPAQRVDFRNDDELKAIGIGAGIDYLFCFFSADSDNVFLTISARAIDQNLNIITIIDDPNSADKLLAAGANKIIDPYEICGHKTHEILTKPEITHILDQTVFRRHDLNIAEIVLPEKSWMENRKTETLNLNERFGLILIGVVDKEFGDQLHFAIGDTDHVLNAGDVLVVMGPAHKIKSFKEHLAAP